MKNSFDRLHMALLAAAFILVAFALPAQAQFICAGSSDGSTGLGPQGASATGSPRSRNSSRARRAAWRRRAARSKPLVPMS